MTISAAQKTKFVNFLLDWNRRINDRPMPWKGEKDPYRIWLSEIILQQTRVEQGLDYYNRFLKTYPNIHSLAAAEDKDRKSTRLNSSHVKMSYAGLSLTKKT